MPSIAERCADEQQAGRREHSADQADRTAPAGVGPLQRQVGDRTDDGGHEQSERRPEGSDPRPVPAWSLDQRRGRVGLVRRRTGAGRDRGERGHEAPGYGVGDASRVAPWSGRPRSPGTSRSWPWPRSWSLRCGHGSRCWPVSARSGGTSSCRPFVERGCDGRPLCWCWSSRRHGGRSRAGPACSPTNSGRSRGGSRSSTDPQPYTASTRVILEIDGERFETWSRGRAQQQRVMRWRGGEWVRVSGERQALESERAHACRLAARRRAVRSGWASDVAPGGPLARASNRIRSAIERSSAFIAEPHGRALSGAS